APTLRITSAEDSGAGNVSRLGTQPASAGLPTPPLPPTTAGPVPFTTLFRSVAAGALLTFTVTHAAADHIDLTGSTADLASGTTRPVTATTYHQTHIMVECRPHPTLLATSAKDSGPATVSGLGHPPAAAAVAT